MKICIKNGLEDNKPYSELRSDLGRIISQDKLSPEVVGRTVLETVDELAREEPLERAKAECLEELRCDLVGKLENVLPASPFYDSYQATSLNVALSRNLWLIMHGQKALLSTPCDVVLQPDENRLAEFGTVLYRKSVMVSSHAGGYNGVGVRVGSGLYYRFGGYAGHSVMTPEVQHIDNGFFILTNKSMYFAGQQMTFRIPYASILRFKAYLDGLGFFRSMGDGREEIFTVVNPWATLQIPACQPLPESGYNVANAVCYSVGWFLYNLVIFLTSPKQPS